VRIREFDRHGASQLLPAREFDVGHAPASARRADAGLPTLSSEFRDRASSIELRDRPVLIGSVSECLVRVEDSAVTRRHARIYKQDSRCWISRDLCHDNLKSIAIVTMLVREIHYTI
jgi:hypothetical protein